MILPASQDAQRRENWLAACLAATYVEMPDQGYPVEMIHDDHIWIPGLLSFPQAPSVALEQGFERVRRVHLAGHVFQVDLSCAIHHPEYRGLQMAKPLVSETYSGKPLESGGTLQASESLVHQAWLDFRQAAHLWAGWTALGSIDLTPSSDLGWERLLATRAGFLRVARQDRAAVVRARGLSQARTDSS